MEEKAKEVSAPTHSGSCDIATLTFDPERRGRLGENPLPRRISIYAVFCFLPLALFGNRRERRTRNKLLSRRHGGAEVVIAEAGVAPAIRGWLRVSASPC